MCKRSRSEKLKQYLHDFGHMISKAEKRKLLAKRKKLKVSTKKEERCLSHNLIRNIDSYKE
jgi:hypothetical protein